MTSQAPTSLPMPVHQPDYMTQQGAAILVARIIAYWHKRGKAVSVWAEELYQHAEPRVWIVRSTMIGGQPHG